MFVINAMDGVCPSSFTFNIRLVHIGSSLSFRLPPKTLDTLKVFGWYKFASHMGTDPVLIALSFYW